METLGRKGFAMSREKVRRLRRMERMQVTRKRERSRLTTKRSLIGEEESPFVMSHESQNNKSQDSQASWSSVDWGLPIAQPSALPKVDSSLVLMEDDKVENMVEAFKQTLEDLTSKTAQIEREAAQRSAQLRDLAREKKLGSCDQDQGQDRDRDRLKVLIEEFNEALEAEERRCISLANEVKTLEMALLKQRNERTVLEHKQIDLERNKENTINAAERENEEKEHLHAEISKLKVECRKMAALLAERFSPNSKKQSEEELSKELLEPFSGIDLKFY